MSLERRVARILGGSSCAVALALAMASPALGAGNGYSPSETSSKPTSPVGFSSVVTAKTVGVKGGTLHARVAGGTISITVPKGATKGSLQVAIMKGRDGTIKRDLPAPLRKHRIIAAFGIELKRGASAARTQKPIVSVFRDKRIPKGAIVVIYNAKTGKFGKTKLRAAKGAIKIRLRAGESIGILAP